MKSCQKSTSHSNKPVFNLGAVMPNPLFSDRPLKCRWQEDVSVNAVMDDNIIKTCFRVLDKMQ